MPRIRIKTARELKTEEAGTTRYKHSDIMEIVSRISRLENLVLQAIDKIEKLEEEVKSLKETRRGSTEYFRKTKRSTPRVVVKNNKQSEKKRTALDILAEQGVVFESDLRSITNKDKFFAYLKRNGIIVLEGLRERIAITDEYLENFMSMITTNYRNPGEVEEKLKDEKMMRLYTFLRESGYLTYDGRNGWKLRINY